MIRTIALVAVIIGLHGFSAMAGPEVGQPAPGFAMPDQYMKTHSLEQYRGKWVVLYFYPQGRYARLHHGSLQLPR